MKIAIYPGTFDPITNGHLDVIERASLLFDEVIVAVLEESNNKNIIFSQKERVGLVEESIVKLENVKVKTFNGLLIKYA